jgi:hypothetical protein
MYLAFDKRLKGDTMARQDKIESFVRSLYHGEKNCYSKQEILAEFDRGVKDSDGIRALFEALPDHEYDQIALTDTLANMLVRGRA